MWDGHTVLKNVSISDVALSKKCSRKKETHMLNPLSIMIYFETFKIERMFVCHTVNKYVLRRRRRRNHIFFAYIVVQQVA